MNSLCLDHLEFQNMTCPDCNLEVDTYGNTEAQFDNCCFPDCGCDGARVCMANNGASDISLTQNVEQMWTGKTRKQRAAVFALVGSLKKGTK